MHKNKLIYMLALIFLLLPALASAFTGESPNYILNRSAFGTIGDNATSLNYAAFTHGNNLIVGNATSPNYVDEIGYIHTLAEAASLLGGVNVPSIIFAYVLPRAVDFENLFIIRANVTDTNNDLVSVNFSLKNATGSYVFQNVNGTGIGEYLWNSTAATASEYGTWTAYINATDAQGNENYTSFTFDVGLATRTVYPREVNLSWFVVWVTNALGRFNITLISPSDIGTYPIKVNSTQGTLYDEKTQNLIVSTDLTPPTISIINPVNESNLSSGTKWTWINITTNEDANCEYSTSDFEFSTGTDFAVSNGTHHAANYSNGTNQLIDGGTYILYYKCNDTSANVALIVHRFNVLSNIPPTQPILSAPASGNLTTLRSFTLYWSNTTDADSKSINYTLQINSSSGVILETNITETANRTNYTLTKGQLDTDIEYYWKVRAYDDADYSSWSDTWNFTIESELLVSLPTSLINFGTLLPGQTANSSALNTPIIIQNAGNILMNVTITGTSIWSTQPNPTNYYKYWIQANETNSYAYANTTDRNMLTSSSVIDIRNLNYSNANNDARLHVHIQTPANEPAGSKNSAITITATG